LALLVGVGGGGGGGGLVDLGGGVRLEGVW
jgi:hypothetical protein